MPRSLPIRPLVLIALALGLALTTSPRPSSGLPLPEAERGLSELELEQRWQLVTRDAAHAGWALRVLAARLDALRPAERSRLMRSAELLAAGCPYNRSALQLAELMRRRSSGYGPLAFALPAGALGAEPAVAREMAELADRIALRLRDVQEALEAHRALNERLGIADRVALPGSTGLELGRQEGALDAEYSGEQAAVAMARVLARVQPQVEALDGGTRQLLQVATEELQVGLEDLWPPKAQLMGVAAELRAIAPLSERLARLAWASPGRDTEAGRRLLENAVTLADDAAQSAELVRRFVALYC